MGRPLSGALLGDSEIVRRVQRLALLGFGTLALLLTWFSGWYWWAWLWAVIPLVVVILPGIRRLVDESWGLAAGLLVVALTLSTHTAGALLSMAWTLAAAVVAGAVASWRRGGLIPLGAFGLTLVGVVASVAVWWSGNAAADAEAARQAELFHEQQIAQLRPNTPRGVVIALVDAVGEPWRADRVCIVFAPQAAEQFAAAQHAPDCVSALGHLHDQIRDFDAYVNQLWIPAGADHVDQRARTASVDACHLEFGNVLSGDSPDAGPQLGRFDMAQQFGAGYLVTNYQPCPVDR